jgi:hypothetical protein
MKNLTLLFCICLGHESYSQSKAVIKFTKTELVVTEGTSPVKVDLPITLIGKWKDIASDEIKVRLRFSGDASSEYDFKKSWSGEDNVLKFKKDDLATTTFSLTILPDEKYEQVETIVVSLSTEGENDKVSVDPNADSLTIRIEDHSQVAKDFMARINGDTDTTLVVGTLSLIPGNSVKLYEMVKQKVTTMNGKTTVESDKKVLLQTQTQHRSKVYKQEQIPQESFKVGDTVAVEQPVKGFGVEVKKALISIYEGLINEMRIETELTDENGLKYQEDFVNISKRTLKSGKSTKSGYTAPIPLRYLKFDPAVGNVALYACGKSGKPEWRNRYLRFDELIYYAPNVSLNYSPGNTEPHEPVTLTQAEPDQGLPARTALKNYVSLHVYSDFLSLIKAVKGNGLVQTEASSKFYLRTRNIPKKNAFLFNYVMPQVKLSRFDNDANSVVPDSASSGTVKINRMLLNQRAFLSAGIKLNIWKLNTKLRNELELNALSRFDWANVRGKQILQKDKNKAVEYEIDRVNMFSMGLELRYQMSQFHNFHITAAGSIYGQKLWNNPDFYNKEWRVYLSPEVEVSYQPITKVEDKIFLRFKTLITTHPGEDKNFVQMQVGYKMLFKFNAQ